MTETSLLKRASWLELFYDLVFVALVAQLTYSVAEHHHTLLDWVHIIIVGYLIFFAWWGTTVVRNIQGQEFVADKLFIQIQMLFAFVMSIALPRAFDGDLSIFLWGYLAIRAIQVSVIELAYRTKKLERPNTNNLIHGILVSLVLVAMASMTPEPYNYVLLCMAIALEILNPLAKGKGNKVRLLNVSHLQERLGLFLLLVMGESVLVVALANTAVELSEMKPHIVFSGVAMMFAVWWSYFHYLEKVGEGIRPKMLMVYLHAHAFLFGSIVLIAAAFKKMLQHSTFYNLDAVLLTLGVMGVGVCTIVIRKQLNTQAYTLPYWLLIIVTPVLGYGLLTLQSAAGLSVVLTAWMCAVVLFDVLK